MLRIVGWGCQPGETCVYCEAPATLYVTEDDISQLPACSRCVPKDTPDPVRDTIIAANLQRRGSLN